MNGIPNAYLNKLVSLLNILARFGERSFLASVKISIAFNVDFTELKRKRPAKEIKKYFLNIRYLLNIHRNISMNLNEKPNNTNANPNNTTPSKNGNLPIGVGNLKEGSGMLGKVLPIMARIIQAVTAPIKKSNGAKNGWSIYKIGSFILIFLMGFGDGVYANVCHGRFVNPITDVCWKCVFPLTIMGIDVVKGNPSPSAPRKPICVCNRPPLNLPIPGIPIGFWEPVRLVDITRTPYCLVNMGGVSIANTGVNYRGDVEESTDDGTHHSFYQVHWYVYPIMYWLEVLTDFVCLENSSIDLAYLTELDPLWNDDQKSFILNPESVLFGNLVAQAACAADCLAASVNLPLDMLFWCNGCQGGLYPFRPSVYVEVFFYQVSSLFTFVVVPLIVLGYLSGSLRVKLA
jgi:conjugal transfer pilus assembly protein TraU